MAAEQGDSGLPGYRGFEYQIEASVWVALTALLRDKRATEIHIEPDSAEDIEIHLVPEEPSVTLTLPVSGSRRLIIQCKTRSTGPWTKDAFSLVIGDGLARLKKGPRGPAPRKRALEILIEEQDATYYLLTNAFVDSNLFDYFQDDLTIPPRRLASVKSLLDKSLQKDANHLNGRVSIVAGLSHELLNLRIEKLLFKHFKVPYQRVERCMAALKMACRARLLGNAPSALTVGTLADIIAGHGGISMELAPRNVQLPMDFERMFEHLRENNVILLVGPSGVGKTTLAQHLAELHRNEPIPFEVFHLQDIGSLYEKLEQPGPTLFVISDPWGNTDLLSTTQLAHEMRNFLTRACHDKRFIITSSSDIYRFSENATKAFLEPYLYKVSEGSYSEDSLWTIAVQPVSEFPSALDAAKRHRREILAVLKTPYEFNMFGLLLRKEVSGCEIRVIFHEPPLEDQFTATWHTTTGYTAEGAKISSILSEAGSLATTVRARKVLARWHVNPVHHSALCWLLLEASESFEINAFLKLYDAIGFKNRISLDPNGFVEYLQEAAILEVHAGWLKIHSFGLRGMAEYVKEHSDVAGPILRHLAQHVIDNVSWEHPAYDSVWRALNLVDILARLVGRAHEAVIPVFERIDFMLEAQCGEAVGSRFADVVGMAIYWQYGLSPFSKLMHAFAPGESDTTPPWYPVNFDYETVQLIINTGTAKRWLPRLIADFIPYTVIWYGFEERAFVSFVTQFNVPLEHVIRQAISTIEDRRWVDRGDGICDLPDLDINIKVLKLLLAAYSSEPYPERPEPSKYED